MFEKEEIEEVVDRERGENMKLKNLLNHIKDDEYVSIGMGGECVCTCKAEDVPKSIQKSDREIKAITTGEVLERNECRVPKINIFCK